MRKIVCMFGLFVALGIVCSSATAQDLFSSIRSDDLEEIGKLIRHKAQLVNGNQPIPIVEDATKCGFSIRIIYEGGAKVPGPSVAVMPSSSGRKKRYKAVHVEVPKKEEARMRRYIKRNVDILARPTSMMTQKVWITIIQVALPPSFLQTRMQ